MRAEATLVGLWPNGNRGDGEAVLYQADATFQHEPNQKRLPLAQAVLAACNSEQAHTIDAPHLGDGVIIVREGLTEHHLQAGHETVIQKEAVEDEKYGEAGALRLSLHGALTVARIHGLLRVHGNKVYEVAPQDDGYKVAVPKEDPVVTEPIGAVPEYKQTYGNSIHIDSSGTFVPIHRLRAYPLPRLPLSRLVRLLSDPLPWKDTTDAFIEGSGSFAQGIRGALRLKSAYVEIDDLHDQARKALIEARQGQPLHPSIVGSSLVLAKLKSMPGGEPRGNHIVTAQLLEK
jgi:hypothetical protein